jgi:hypothetical protein
LTEPSARYRRLYAAILALAVVFSSLPPYEILSGGGRYRSFGTMWEMAATPGGGPARLAMVLLALKFVCLVAATVRPDIPVLPPIIALTVSAVIVLLLTRPATGEPTPALNLYSWAQVILAGCIVIVCAIHSAHFLRHLRRVDKYEAAPATDPAGRFPAGPVST